MRGVRGWVLAGHTHGGQVKPPFLPSPVLLVRNKRYAAGEFSLEAARTMYVDRGLGRFFRLRFNVRPEMTPFTLTDEGVPAGRRLPQDEETRLARSVPVAFIAAWRPGIPGAGMPVRVRGTRATRVLHWRSGSGSQS
jgi:hypothetical protein